MYAECWGKEKRGMGRKGVRRLPGLMYADDLILYGESRGGHVDNGGTVC